MLDGWPRLLHLGCCMGPVRARLCPQQNGLAFLRGHPAHTHCHAPQALVLLQLHADLDVLLVASWQELSQYVCAFTKALSQRPSKYAPPKGPSGGGTGLEGHTDEGSQGSVWVSLSFQAVPGLPGLFLLHSRALGLRSASGQRWLWAPRSMVAANQTVQPGQPSCG